MAIIKSSEAVEIAQVILQVLKRLTTVLQVAKIRYAIHYSKPMKYRIVHKNEFQNSFYTQNQQFYKNLGVCPMIFIRNIIMPEVNVKTRFLPIVVFFDAASRI